jgi:HAD superfamily hydrolase (TIGR01509 family)
MIKNIVFDLGNVLISFKPSEFLDKMGYSSETKNIILSDIFKSEEWRQIDNGDISTDEAIVRISERSALKLQVIASFFDLRKEILSPITDNIKLLPALKKRGFMLYFLSNFPEDIFDELYNEYNFPLYFDGGIISARVKTSKPDIKIFKILLEKYFLSPEECLFLDDIELNINAANSVGMKGVLVPDAALLSDLIEKNLEISSFDLPKDKKKS